MEFIFWGDPFPHIILYIISSHQKAEIIVTSNLSNCEILNPTFNRKFEPFFNWRNFSKLTLNPYTCYSLNILLKFLTNHFSPYNSETTKTNAIVRGLTFKYFYTLLNFYFILLSKLTFHKTFTQTYHMVGLHSRIRFNIYM